MQIMVIAAVLLGCVFVAYVFAQDEADDTARQHVVSEARTLADTPTVRQAVVSRDPTAVLQSYAEQVRRDTGVSFITIMSPSGIRFTHPNPAEIGRHFLGHRARALAGHTFTETYRGTLGRSIRVVTPVWGTHGEVSALVSVGVTVHSIDSRLCDQLLALSGLALAALAVTGIGTWLVGSRLRRHTHGMGAQELGRMYDYHEATLHAVREGLLLLDKDREGQIRITLCNDSGRELLGLPADTEGRRLDDLGLPESLITALVASEPRVDEVHLTAERVVLVNTRPVRTGSRRGVVATLRDHTELQALSGELDSVRGFAEALRSQAHEASNRLHTIVSLIALGRPQEAEEFATAELGLAQALTDQVITAVAEPVLAALLLGKAAEANERGVDFRVTSDSRIDDRLLPPALSPRDLVTILGNLIDNALDASIEAAGSPESPGSPSPRPYVEVTARIEEGQLLLRVADSGRGVDAEELQEVFRRGWSTKQAADDRGRGIGLALVQQTAHRGGGTVHVDREVGAVFTVRLPVAEHERRTGTGGVGRMGGRDSGRGARLWRDRTAGESASGWGSEGTERAKA